MSTLTMEAAQSGTKNTKTSTTPKSIITLQAVGKKYPIGTGFCKALDQINLSINPAEFIAVIGKSGSGKTTLMNIITGIDYPTEGEIWINNQRIDTMSQKQLSKWRGRNIGIVFQFFQLLPTLTVLENVMLPMDFCGTYKGRERQERGMSLLHQVGIADQANKFPGYLSGGQQQRAAIARSLANDPAIICADEPTGNLDSHTSDTILSLFRELSDLGKTILMVTHERDISHITDREIRLLDGQVESDIKRNNNDN